MADDDLFELRMQFGKALAHIAVRRAVRAVLPDGMFLIVFVGQGIHVRLRRHGAVERVVEDDDLRDVFPEDVFRGVDALDVRRVVERGEVAEHVDVRLDLFVDEAALFVEGAALNDPVADGRDLVEGVDDLEVALGEDLFDFIERGGVVGHGNVEADLLSLCLRGDLAVEADALAKTGGDGRFIVHVDELILERRGAAVDDEDFHRVLLPNPLFAVHYKINCLTFPRPLQ